MKIKTDEEMLIFPIDDNRINILIENDRKKRVLDYLFHYFIDKKKTLCAIYDDNDEIIKNKDLDLIYIPYGLIDLNNFRLKEKTCINSLISNIILENPKYFASIENARNSLYELATDSGFYKIIKILNNGIDKNIKIELKKYNIPTLISMFEINYEDTDEVDLYLMLYNAMLFTSRSNSTNIIYLDIPITNKVINWIKQLDKNVIILINATSLTSIDIDSVVIKLGLSKQVESYDLSIDNLSRFIYMNNPYIINNLYMQTEENIKYYNQFNDENVNYLLKFTINNTK